MEQADVYLRCCYLSSVADSKPAQTPDATTQTETRIFSSHVIAHWQIECNGKIYEIKREGNWWWDPWLKPGYGNVKDSQSQVFYRVKIGTTTKTAEEIRQIAADETPAGPYSAFYRSCQTSTKRLADRIMAPGDKGAEFEWPWSLTDVSTLAFALTATAATGTAVYLYFPGAFGAGVYGLQIAGNKLISFLEVNGTMVWHCMNSLGSKIYTGKDYARLMFDSMGGLRVLTQINKALFDRMDQIINLWLLPRVIIAEGTLITAATYTWTFNNPRLFENVWKLYTRFRRWWAGLANAPATKRES